MERQIYRKPFGEGIEVKITLTVTTAFRYCFFSIKKSQEG